MYLYSIFNSELLSVETSIISKWNKKINILNYLAMPIKIIIK